MSERLSSVPNMNITKLGMMAHVCNPDAGETEAGDLWGLVTSVS